MSADVREPSRSASKMPRLAPAMIERVLIRPKSASRSGMGTLPLQSARRSKKLVGMRPYFTGGSIPNAQCPMPNAQCPMPKPECLMPVLVNWALCIGHCELGIDRLLACPDHFGVRLPLRARVGCWSRVAGVLGRDVPLGDELIDRLARLFGGQRGVHEVAVELAELLQVGH